MVCFEGITYKASDNVGKLPGQAEKDSDNVGKPPGQSEKDSDIVGRMEIKQIKMNKKKCCIIYLTI